jgi:hypothetical protein
MLTTFMVDSTADVIDDTDNQLTLREAVMAASMNAEVGDADAGSADGDVILFDSTVFGGAGNEIELSLGDLAISDDLIIDGLTGTGGGATNVTITVTGNSRIFSIDTNGAAGSQTNVLIRGLTLQGGDGTGTNTAVDGLGGAIYISAGENVSLSGTVLRDNTAEISGGAVYSTSSTLRLTNVTIGESGLGNSAAGDAETEGGGGLYALGGSLTILNSTFTDNDATGSSGSGGGLFMNGGQLTVFGGEFDNNSASRAGGGLEIRAGTTTTTATLTNVTVANNSASANPGNGGGLHISAVAGSSTTTVTINGGTFTQNSAASEGGGLWNDVGSTLTINGASINMNTAAGATADEGGGGVFNNGGILNLNSVSIIDNMATGALGSGGGVLSDGGTLNVVGGVLSGNTAVRAGGAIEITAENRNAAVTLNSVSISGNSTGNAVGNGGAIHVTDTVGGFASQTNITGGAIIGNIANQEGGGVWNDAGGIMTIDGTLISANTALMANAAADAQGGGGVFNNGGTMFISNATIIGNIASGTAGTDDGGAGIFNDGRDSAATITISNTTISGNSADTGLGNGGGILNIGDADTVATININGGSISGNTAARAGGGIENNVGVMTLTGVTVDGNTADINGGGLHQTGAATITIVESTFSNNSAGAEGGGLWNSNDANAVITLVRSTVNDNDAVDGGGLFNDGTAGTIRIINSTISGNTATNGGGIDAEGGVIDVDNSTIALNVASVLGGGLNLDTGVTATLDSTIVAYNSAAVGVDVNGSVTANFSLIQNVAGATISGGNNLTGVDPQLGALTDNGGPTLTHLPEDDSPVLNTGSNPLNLNIDQRGVGFVRTAAGQTDIGAVELAADIDQHIVIGQGSNGNTVQVVNATTGAVIFTIDPFPGFLGGVHVALGDLTGDNVDDIIVAAGASGGPNVKVYDGSTGLQIDGPLGSFFAYDAAFTGGVFVAVADVNNDTVNDIITGAGAGGGPNVKVFSGTDGSVIANFFAYDAAFTGGVRVAAGDFNGDGYAEVVTGAGAGGGPNVKIFSGLSLTGGASVELASYFAYDPAFTGGVYVAVGDVNNDTQLDVVTGAGEGGGAHVKAFSGATTTTITSFLAYDVGYYGGVRVGVGEIAGDAAADIITAPGMGASLPVRIYDATSASLLASFMPSVGSEDVFVSGGGFVDLQALRVAGGAIDASPTLLTDDALQAVAQDAIRMWMLNDLSDWQIDRLSDVTFELADYSADVLGTAANGRVLIDRDAAGYGWALTEADLAEGNRVDLLTAVAHELGHILGYDDLDAMADDLLAAELEPGVRKTP